MLIFKPPPPSVRFVHFGKWLIIMDDPLGYFTKKMSIMHLSYGLIIPYSAEKYLSGKNRLLLFIILFNTNYVFNFNI